MGKSLPLQGKGCIAKKRKTHKGGETILLCYRPTRESCRSEELWEIGKLITNSTSRPSRERSNVRKQRRGKGETILINPHFIFDGKERRSNSFIDRRKTQVACSVNSQKKIEVLLCHQNPLSIPMLDPYQIRVKEPLDY